MVEKEYQKIAHYILRIFSLVGRMSFSCHIEATEEKLIVFPVSQYGQKLPLSLNIVHISTMRRNFEEMAVTQDETGYYQLEMPYKEIVEMYETEEIHRDA